MIDIKQLRLGNYVTTVLNDTPLRITCIKQQEVKDGIHSLIRLEYKDGYLQEHLHPIPLTPEWLERCGFEKYTCNIGNNNIPFEYTDYRLGNLVVVAGGGKNNIEFAPLNFDIESRNHLLSIDYVHQLQNLYHALTNTELTITL